MNVPSQLLLCIIIMFQFPIQECEGQDLRFKHLTMDDGLSSNTVWSILQDKKGYIWFGTSEGLNKYDGYNITTYQFIPHDTTSIAQNTILTLFEDSEGIIWLGTIEGGICKFDRQTEKFTVYKPPSSHSYLPELRAVSAIGEDQEGNIWAGTFTGELRSFNKKTIQFSEPYDIGYNPDQDTDNHDVIYVMYKDRSGSLWVGNETGLHKLNLTHGNEGKNSTTNFTHYQHDPKNESSLSSNIVTSIYEDERGLFWIGTLEGLNLFDLETGTFRRFLHEINNPSSLSDNFIAFNSIAEDGQGNLWVGVSNGLNRLNPLTMEFTHFYHDPADPSSLSSNNVRSMFRDKLDNLWICTEFSGVNQLDFKQKPFRLYSNNPNNSQSIGDKFVYAIYVDREGNKYFGDSEGLHVQHKKTGKYSHFQYNFPNNKNPIDHTVEAILEMDSGNLLIIYGNQLFQFNRHKEKFIATSGNNILDNSVKGLDLITLFKDIQNVLWVGSKGGLRSYNLKTNEVKQYIHEPEKSDGLSDFEVLAIQEDNNGNLWIGHGSVATSKLNKETGRFTRYSHNPLDTTSISSNFVNDIFLDSRGTVWIGTKGGGLCRYNEATDNFTTYTEKHGLSNSSVNKILEDEEGNLWVTTIMGLSKFSPAMGSFTNFDINDGLKSNKFSPRSGYKSEDGSLYFGGSKGFIAFQPHAIQPNSFVPPVIITQFSLFDQPVHGKHEFKEIELKHNQNFFSFEFATLNFTNSEKNQYAYQLEGVDKEWVYSGSRRLASYTDVAPGEYIFRVRGSNNDGIWNTTGTSIRLLIHPPFWRTWWAYGVYFLFFLAGVFAIDRNQRKRLIQKEREKAREKELAQAKEIEQAYHQLENAHKDLEVSHQTLKSTQAQLIQSEKMASLGELTAGIAHEIQNPLNFVNNFSEVSAELLDEVKETRTKSQETRPKTEEDEIEDEILEDIKQNLVKINHHGKRADAIVKGMLEHSRTGSGEKELTDINTLTKEYLSLAFQSFKSKNEGVEIKLITEFDPSLHKIELVRADIGKVLLNILNNAFYACTSSPLSTDTSKFEIHHSSRHDGQAFDIQKSPNVTVTTKLREGSPSGLSRELGRAGGSERKLVQISISDNGPGIPSSIKDKIFQPFFTTKPTGQGTGLGLSLSYDIVKAHGGELKVNSKEAEGSEFLIFLPYI